MKRDARWYAGLVGETLFLGAMIVVVVLTFSLAGGVR